MRYEIISETPLAMAEVLHMLEKVKKDDELNFRAQKAYDHLTQTSKLSLKKVNELDKKLSDLDVSRLREAHIKKLIDLLPVTEKDAKLVLSGFNVTFTNADLKKMVDIIKEYVNE